MAGLQLNGLLRFRLVELRRLHIGLAHEESVSVESSSLQQVSDDVSLTVWCRDYYGEADWSESHNVLLRQLSSIIKTQIKEPTPPY